MSTTPRPDPAGQLSWRAGEAGARHSTRAEPAGDLSVGGNRPEDAASGYGRRAWLRRVGGGLGQLGLATALSTQGPAAAGAGRGELPLPHFTPRVRRVIHLFMNGGPFQADLFDPKPALKRYAGQRPAAVDLRTERKTGGLLPSPFKFARHGQSGLPISELLPNLARCSDELCVLRSVHTENPNHGPALLLMNNGTITPNRPSMGAWFSYGLGTENQDLPAYVVLCPGRPVRFSILWNSAFLPARHQGTYINHSQLQPEKLIPFLRNARTGPDRQQQQLALMRDLNELHLAERADDTRLEARIQAMETAFRMQFAASEAFDLERESQTVRRQYGSGHFANGCLLARRLVERGVRFVQLYYGNGQPWDTHRQHDDNVRKLCRDADQPMAALLTDLKARGLLDDTLVVWGGEFGRTPTSEDGSGRDHNHYGFTMWLAGGGVRGGMAYGATDEFGFRAVEQPVAIHDLHATILHLLGLDHLRLTYPYAGREFRLTDVAGNVLHDILA